MLIILYCYYIYNYYANYFKCLLTSKKKLNWAYHIKTKCKLLNFMYPYFVKPTTLLMFKQIIRPAIAYGIHFIRTKKVGMLVIII